MATDAAAESTLWADCLLPGPKRERRPVFSPLGEARYALGLETIYEGYLVHHGRPRLFAPPDDDTALLLGDYLYAHGVARISALQDVAAVADLAELISLCSQVRAEETDGDGPLWAATAALLGRGFGMDQSLEPLLKAGAIGHAGQVVVVGALAQLLF